jgi:hypothetical protein
MVDLLSAAVDPSHIGIDVGSFLVVVITGAIAGTVAVLAAGRGLLTLIYPIMGMRLRRGVGEVRPEAGT